MKKIFLLILIIILSLSLFNGCSPATSPAFTPSEGEGEVEPTGDRVVLVELFNTDGCSASTLINPIMEDLAQQYGTDQVILLEEAGWGKYSTPETMERFDWYVPGTKHTPFIAFNGLSETFSEGVVGGGGGGGYTPPEPQVIIPETTKVADEETEAQVVNVAPDHSEITFAQSTPQLNELQPGDVLVMGITTQTPYGLLRKVSSITRSGRASEVIVQTEPAKLEDAVEKGTFELEKTLLPEDVRSSISHIKGVKFLDSKSRPQSTHKWGWDLDCTVHDYDHDPDTLGDNIRVEGRIDFDYTIIFDGSIRWFKLQTCEFRNELDVTENFEVIVGGDLIDFDESYTLTTITFSPIPVPIGPVVIYLVPQIDLIVGVEGNIFAELRSGVVRGHSKFEAGIELVNGNWQPIYEDLTEFSYDEGQQPTVEIGADVKAYAGPQLECMIFNMAGPHCNIFGYLDFHANNSETPWWVLNGGLEVSAGIDVEALTYHWSSPEYLLFNWISVPPIAQASGGSPEVGYISGKVEDAVVHNAIQGVSVKVYDGNLLICSDITDSSGNYYLTIPAGNYKVEFTKNGYISANIHDVSVEEGITTYLEKVLYLDEQYLGEGEVSGTISNALTGGGVSGLTINLREGINVTSGTVITSAATESEGYYSIVNLNAGYYTAEISGTGYNTTYFTVICIGGTTTENQDATITPNISEEQTRFVLRWGETPHDLDAHLTGPAPDGTRFHLYWIHAPNHGGVSPWPEYINLDLDDMDSYGPETITITQQIPGVYRFSVHDYSNKNSSYSTALANSGAYVQVYRGSELIATYNVPSNKDGTLWTVCEIDGVTMTPINEMSYESEDSNVRSLFVTDAELIRNLPIKR